ncbi:MAG: T9SS type A sorting domain-containing protein [Bacteroidales bacterium]|nr:T9SS type A sorting domain-containing protein [Bacteroidales bacterium]
MKNIGLFLAAILGIFAVNAQTFKFYYQDEEIKESVNIVPQEGGMSTDFFDIENISGKDVTFKVQIVKKLLAEGATISMCFGDQCLTDTISQKQTLEAGGKMEHHFDLQYIYGKEIISTVVVNMLDENDALLQSFTVNYGKDNDINCVAQNEKSVQLSAVAQPNPAANFTTFTYSVPAKYTKANLVVRNALGSVVNKTPVKVGSTGKITMNTSELANGVYFYSITSDGVTLVTKKLIIKH